MEATPAISITSRSGRSKTAVRRTTNSMHPAETELGALASMPSSSTPCSASPDDEYAPRTTADFATVQHHVVSPRQAAARIGLDFGGIIGAWRGEGMVQGIPALVVLVPLEHREIDDPQGVPIRL